MSEKSKILKMEDYLAKRKPVRAKIEDLVKQIEKDEFTLFKEKQVIKELYFQGRYDFDES